MYIRRITLEDIRGFEHLEFDLDRGGGEFAGWTVFTGDNGSGKSTLLKAIAIALTGKEGARALQPSFDRWIREGASEAAIQLEMVGVAGDDSYSAQGRPPAKHQFPARVSLKNGGRETTIDEDKPHGVAKPAITVPRRSIWSTEATGWFSCGYGPFRRVFGASPEATRQMVSPMSERFVTMFQEAASLAEVDQWMRNLSHKALEGKPEEAAQLDLLKAILNDDLMPDGVTIDSVDSDGLWLRDRNGVRLAWSDMSDGFRAALALLGDILRHLIKAYGLHGLKEIGSAAKIVIRRSGVVLIDEIDAHLHPEWQRQIGFWLKRHFPNIQFLVTTHSPIILQAADKHGLFTLPAPGSGERPRALTDEEYATVIRSKPDTILLTSAFGLANTRSPLAVEKRAQYSRLATKRRSGARLSAAESKEFGQLAFWTAPDGKE